MFASFRKEKRRVSLIYLFSISSFNQNLVQFLHNFNLIIREAFFKEDNHHMIESKSGSINGSKEHLIDVVSEAVPNHGNAEKTANVSNSSQ